MLSIERRFVDWAIRHRFAIMLTMISMISLLIRYPLRRVASGDLSAYLVP